MLTDSQMQVALNAAGFGPLIVDGKVGPKTLNALKSFQRLNQLMPDGVFGPKTSAKLEPHFKRVHPQPVPKPAGGNVFSAIGMKMLGESEGIRTKAYPDTKNIVTIGIGATWGSAVFREWWERNRPGEEFSLKSSMTLDEINEVTRRMIDEEYGAAVNRMIDNKPIPQYAYDAAVHFIYNVGTGGTSWRWAAPFKAGDYCAAAAIIRTYLKPPELKGRREKEATLMCKGIYST